MELWIRSQDKDFLMKIDNINLGCENDESNKTIKPRRLFTFVRKTSFTLGVYATEQRALKVLDEIQNLLKPKAMVKVIDTSVKIEDNLVYRPQEYAEITPLSNDIVYEMPKE